MTEREPLLEWAARVAAMPQESNGVDRAVMPASWGGTEWAFDMGGDQ